MADGDSVSQKDLFDWLGRTGMVDELNDGQVAELAERLVDEFDIRPVIGGGGF